MIYTLTANPAIDYHMDLTAGGFIPGAINRSEKEEMFPGGKGLNVSVILARLGAKSTAWAFAAGKTGKLLEALAAEKGCRCDFIWLPEGETRINVKLDCAQETAVNGRGPLPGPAQEEELWRRVKALGPGDTLVLSGNLHSGAGDLYAKICGICAERQVRTIVDTEGDALRGTFRAHPFLIKPNEEELLSLFGYSEGSPALLRELMSRCRGEGARNVLLTMGGEGALLLAQDGRFYEARLLRRRAAVSTVGAGDSTIAGFLAGLARGDDLADALRLACAAGCATAYTKWLADKEEIEAAARDIAVN